MNLERTMKSECVFNEGIYKGVRKIEVQKGTSISSRQDGTLPITEGGFRPNEYALLSSTLRNRLPVCKFNEKEPRIKNAPYDSKMGIQRLNIEQRDAPSTCPPRRYSAR